MGSEGEAITAHVYPDPESATVVIEEHPQLVLNMQQALTIEHVDDMRKAGIEVRVRIIDEANLGRSLAVWLLDDLRGRRCAAFLFVLAGTSAAVLFGPGASVTLHMAETAMVIAGVFLAVFGLFTAANADPEALTIAEREHLARELWKDRLPLAWTVLSLALSFGAIVLTHVGQDEVALLSVALATGAMAVPIADLLPFFVTRNLQSHVHKLTRADTERLRGSGAQGEQGDPAARPENVGS